MAPGRNKSRTYRVIFTRHGESESNVPDNSAVSKMDPLLTTDKTRAAWSKAEMSGRDYCSSKTRAEYQDMFDNPDISHVTTDSPVVISSLSRAIQTAIIALPAERLNNRSGITISPLIAEQTTWFSDRTRPLGHLRRLVDKELRGKPGITLPLGGLDDFNLEQLVQPVPEDALLVGTTFGKLAAAARKADTTHPRGGNPAGVNDRDNSNNNNNKPWHLKHGLWHPENLVQRGQEAVKMLIMIGRAAYVEDDDRPTPAILVFGHGGFVNYMTQTTGLTEEHLNSSPPKLTDWATGETRIFELLDEDPDEPPVASLLVETQESRKRHLRRNGGVDGEDMRHDRQHNERVRISLQAKIMQIDEEYRTGHLYVKALEDGINPPDVDGNHEDYVKDI